MVLEQILTDLENTSRELTLEMNSLTNSLSGNQTIPIPEGLDDYLDQLTTSRTKIYGEKIKALQDLFKLQQALADPKNPQMGMGIYILNMNIYIYKYIYIIIGFHQFNTGAMSPIKWATSKVAYVERASDSITIDARFFHNDTKKQSAGSFADDVSRSAKGTVKGFGSNVGAAAASAVHNQIAETAETQALESTLLLTATATHSKVMQFEKMEIDEELLANAWNHYWVWVFSFMIINDVYIHAIGWIGGGIWRTGFNDDVHGQGFK